MSCTLTWMHANRFCCHCCRWDTFYYFTIACDTLWKCARKPKAKHFNEKQIKHKWWHKCKNKLLQTVHWSVIFYRSVVLEQVRVATIALATWNHRTIWWSFSFAFCDKWNCYHLCGWQRCTCVNITVAIRLLLCTADTEGLFGLSTWHQP